MFRQLRVSMQLKHEAEVNWLALWAMHSLHAYLRPIHIIIWLSESHLYVVLTVLEVI